MAGDAESTKHGVLSKLQSKQLPQVLMALLKGERYIDPSISHAVVSLSEKNQTVKQLSDLDYNLLDCYFEGLTIAQTAMKLSRDLQSVKNARRRLFYRLGTSDKSAIRSILQ